MVAIQGIGTKPKKQFAGSYSKLKNFESCALKHNEVDLLKTYVEPSGPGTALYWGDQVHKAMANACVGNAPLPKEMEEYQIWVDRVRAGPGQLLVEQQYAIRRDFTGCTWFAKDAWWRGIGDVVRIDGPVALVLDWKTGNILEDSVQLGLMAQCIFSHYPGVQRVRSEFIWLKEACSSPEVFSRQDVADMWAGGLLQRVAELEGAWNTGLYPPKPSGLCKKHCPVQKCEFYGKGNR